jgi:hypothetical protein
MIKVENFLEKDYVGKQVKPREDFANLILEVMQKNNKPMRVWDLCKSDERLACYTVQKVTGWMKNLIMWGYVQREVVGYDYIRVSKNRYVKSPISVYSLIM